jgi:hypothetical protein
MLQLRVGEKGWLSLDACPVSPAKQEDVMRSTRRQAAVLCRVAALLTVLVAAAAAAIASGADVGVSIHAKLSRGGERPVLELAGARNGRKTDRYAIKGSLRSLPCPGTYRLVIASSGPRRVSYDATFALRKSGGDRVRCGAELSGKLGRRFARMHVYGTGATAADSVITVDARRIGATAIKGLFTTSDLLCDPAYRLRVQLSSASAPVSMLYEMRMKKVSLNGRRCR